MSALVVIQATTPSACSRYRLGAFLHGRPSLIELLTVGGVVSATVGVLLVLISDKIADESDARRRPPIGARAKRR